MRTESCVRLHTDLLQSENLFEGLPHTAGGIRPICPEDEDGETLDSPSKSVLIDVAGHPFGVLMLSNAVNEKFVSRAVDQARIAKEMLGEKLGNVILETAAEGVFRGLSYAVWPFREPLSSARFSRFLQKKILAPRALRWLREASERTRREVDETAASQSYGRPLEFISTHASLPPAMREAAKDAIARLESGVWRPFYTLEHGDFWFGNMLLPTKSTRRFHPLGFVLIDWGGSKSEGNPFLDLLRFGKSVGLRDRGLRMEIAHLCRVLRCDSCGARSYLLAALGTLGMNLEYFPETRYLETCVAVFAQLERVLPESSQN